MLSVQSKEVVYFFLALFVFFITWFQIDFETCFFDGCRYANSEFLNVVNTELSNGAGLTTSVFMHYVYGYFNAVPYYYVPLAFGVLLYLVLLRFNTAGLSKWVLPFLLSPGKEAFLIGSMFLAVDKDLNWMGWALLIALCLLARPEFLPTIVAMRFAAAGNFKLFTMLVVVSLFVPTQGTELIFSESELPWVNEIRDLSRSEFVVGFIIKFLIYFIWYLFYPLFEIYRYFISLYNGSLNTLNAALLLTAFYVIFNWRVHYNLRNLLLLLCPIVFLSLIFPIVHTRYLLPFLVFCWLVASQYESQEKKSQYESAGVPSCSAG